MALYKHGNYLSQSQDVAFDQDHQPGARTPHSGIYRCVACGDEIAASEIVDAFDLTRVPVDPIVFSADDHRWLSRR